MRIAKKVCLVRCKNCDKESPFGNFCINCGNPLDKGRIEKMMCEVTTCIFCGRTVIKGNYCVVCGKKLEVPYTWGDKFE